VAGCIGGAGNTAGGDTAATGGVAGASAVELGAAGTVAAALTGSGALNPKSRSVPRIWRVQAVVAAAVITLRTTETRSRVRALPTGI
jgi:hypothetical protein